MPEGDSAPRPRSRPETWLLVAIVGLGLIRGLFWIAAYQAPWNDEPAHLSYVQSIATGHAPPVIGRDHISTSVLDLFKGDPVGGVHTWALPPDPSLPAWGLIGASYEGYQTPLYYVAMAPAWWVGHALGGAAGALFLIRLASLLSVLAAIPLIDALARRVFPRRRAVPLLAASVFTAIQLTTSHATLVDNDSIMPLVGVLAMLAFARMWDCFTPRRALLFGGSVAGLLLAKATGSALIPLLAVGAAALAHRHRADRRVLAHRTLLAALPVVVLVLPVLLYNLAEYHALSGAKVEAALVAPIVGSLPPGFAAVQSLWHSMAATLFAAPEIPSEKAAGYRDLWAVLSFAALFGLVIAVFVSAKRRDALIGLIAAATMPLGVLLLIGADLSQLGHQAVLSGRHLGVLLPVAAVLIALGAELAAGAFGVVVAVIAVLVTGFVEIPGDRAWVLSTYTQGKIGSSAPVVEQTYADGSVPLSRINIRMPCAVTYVAFEVIAPSTPPATIAVNGTPAPLAAQLGVWSTYSVQAAPGTLGLQFGTPQRVAVQSIAPSGAGISAPGAPGVIPLARGYCEVADPDGSRFRALYPAHHPWPMSLDALRTWPLVDAIGAVAVAFAAAGAWVVRRRRMRDGWSMPRLSRPRPGASAGVASGLD